MGTSLSMAGMSAERLATFKSSRIKARQLLRPQLKGKETLGEKVSSVRQTNDKLLVEEINTTLLWTDHFLKGSG